MILIPLLSLMYELLNDLESRFCLNDSFEFYLKSKEIT